MCRVDVVQDIMNDNSRFRKIIQINDDSNNVNSSCHDIFDWYRCILRNTHPTLVLTLTKHKITVENHVFCFYFFLCKMIKGNYLLITQRKFILNMCDKSYNASEMLRLSMGFRKSIFQYFLMPAKKTWPLDQVALQLFLQSVKSIL